jgi:hypothetical protein
LVNSFWQSLRQQTFAKTGNHCEICGSWNGLECHELWEYHEPTARFAKQGIAGVQRLIELMPLCNRCHETYHFGLAGKKNRSEIVASRIAGYNRYRPDEISEYLAFLIKSWRRRNNYRWVLDLSVLSPLQLSIQERWVTDEDGALTTITERATSNTGLLGIPWRRGEQSFAAIPAEQGYFG